MNDFNFDGFEETEDASWVRIDAQLDPIIESEKEMTKAPFNNNRLGLRFAQIDDSGAVVHWLRFSDDRRKRDPRAVCGHQRPVG